GVGGEHVPRGPQSLRLGVAEERAEEQEEHQRERERRHAVHGQAEQLQELEPRLGGDELDQVAPRTGRERFGGHSGGGHASTPSSWASDLLAASRWRMPPRPRVPSWPREPPWPRVPPVMLRNASSSVAPCTSSPWRASSAFSSA